MKLKYARQLELYKFAKDLVLCEMEIVPRKVYYYHGQQNGYRTHRWMQPEHWAEFEYELERLLSKRTGTNHNVSNIPENYETQFHLNSCIVVNIRKLSTSEYKEPIEKSNNSKQCTLVLKCKFEYRSKRDSSISKLCAEGDKSETLEKHKVEKHNETAGKSGTNSSKSTNDAAKDQSAHAVAVHPSKNERKLIDATSEVCNSFEKELNAVAFVSPKIQASVNKVDTKKRNDEKEQQLSSVDIKKSKENEDRENRKKKKHAEKNGENMSKKKLENSSSINSNGDSSDKLPVKKRRLHGFASEKNSLDKWLNPKEVSVEIIESDTEIERKQYTREQFSITKEVEKSEQQMKVNQIKLHEKNEKDSLKKDVEKRESKRIHESKLLIMERKKSPIEPLNYKYLTLDDLSSEELTSSLAKYKTVLDDIFKDNKTDSIVHSYNELDHYLVISLIDHKKQMDMMNKLSDVYQCDNGTLIANALLPEWLIRLFMQRYEVTRADAIAQIKSQEASKIHSSSSNSHKESDPDLTLKQCISK